MDNKIYYIYVLKLMNDGIYVGCTKNIEKRLLVHLSSGGAIATKESKPAEILKIYTLNDYYVYSFVCQEYAHKLAEVMIANEYAESIGYNKVRGAKHGMGWNDEPTPNCIRTIKMVQRFAKTEKGINLRNALISIDVDKYNNL
jgi:predicted GIY-YIG superfamily endonuclease